MPLLATGEGFWVAPNIVDVAGLVLALGSIWLAWFLAKRDLDQRIDRAQRETSDRMVVLLLQSELSEIIRFVETVKKWCREKHWDRALDHCEQAKHRIPRFRSLPGLTVEEGTQLDQVIDQLRLLISYIEGIIAPGTRRTELSQAKMKDLSNIVAVLSAIEGRIRASALR